MPFTYEENVSSKFIEPSIWPPTAQTNSIEPGRLITLYMRYTAAEHVSHSITSLDDVKAECAPAGGWENVDQETIDKPLITGVTN